MQFQVPHFLETEQRIWGPFTFTNFVIMLGVAGFLAILYLIGMNFILWVIITVVIAGVTLWLMFGSYNGRPIYAATVDFFKHLTKRGKRTWAGVETRESVSDFVLTEEKLRDLPNVGQVKPADTKPLAQRIEEISKSLDER